MYLLGGFDDAVLLAFLAQRVLPYLAVTDSFPRSAVGFIYIRGAFIFIVFLPCLFAVLLTVLSVCEVGATGI